MKRLILTLLCCVLVGCSSTRGTYADKDKLDLLEPGVTTYAQMVEIMGSEPISRSLDTSGKSTAVWHYIKVQSGFYSFDTNQQMVSAIFTPEDVLERHVVSNTTQ